jgi:hypothetical protein
MGQGADAMPQPGAEDDDSYQHDGYADDDAEYVYN